MLVLYITTHNNIAKQHDTPEFSITYEWFDISSAHKWIFSGSWPLVCETNDELTVSYIEKKTTVIIIIISERKRKKKNREAVQTVPFFDSYSVQRCAFDPSFD